MEKKITEIIRKHATEENIKNNSTLRSLGLDSLDAVEIQMEIESAFDITFPRDIMQKISVDTTIEQLEIFTNQVLSNI